jgi:carotenoid cleavage dioxygenase-like enzyme
MQTTLAAPVMPIAPYGLGFTSLDREVSVDALPISGTLPPWLSGSLLRNGPARFEIGADRYRHWFDGLAMLHRFTVAGGRVSYANRFLRSPAFLEAERLHRIACTEFATDPHRSPLGRVAALFRSTAGENANVNVVPYADGYLALTETPNPVAFDGVSLETRGVVHYDDTVAGQITSAHTQRDRSRRATFNILIEIGRTSTYKVVRIEDGTLRRAVIAEVAVDQPAYMHAFATTDRYVIIAEYPFVVRSLDLLLHRKPFIENYRWVPGRGTRFHVVRKDGGAAAGTFEADAFFAFHHINAFEEGDAIVLDIAAYDDATIIGDFSLDRVRDPHGDVARATFRRYRLVPGRSAAEIENLAPQTIELPQVAAKHAAAPYRYAYGVDTDGTPPGIFNRLVKVDLTQRNATAWAAPHAYPGEPVFVARPGGSDEDDGVVLSVVLDAEAAASYLVILDARDFTECARVHVPHHIPFGFHGTFRSQPLASSTIV